MALVIINAVLSHFDFVAKFSVKNLNKDFTNSGRGGGHHFVKVFLKILGLLSDCKIYAFTPGLSKMDEFPEKLQRGRGWSFPIKFVCADFLYSESV